jgi:hypothetical protein
MQHDSMLQQSAALDAQIDQLSANPQLNEKAGGILGFGQHPPEAQNLQCNSQAVHLASVDWMNLKS